MKTSLWSQRTGALLPVHTHGIAQRREITLLRESAALRWRGLYASLVQESPWSAELPEAEAPGIAFCLAHPCRVARRLERHTHDGVLRPQQFSVLPAHQPSRWTIAGSPRILHLYIRAELFQEVAEGLFGRRVSNDVLLPRLCEHDPVIAQLAGATLDLLCEGDRHSPYLAEHLAHLLAGRLLSHHSLVPQQRAAEPATLIERRWQRLRDYIEAHLADDLSLPVLAEQAGVHPTQLWRAFRTHLGVSPHQYILGRRLAWAQRQLREAQTSIADIAASCGFSSQSHLSSAFKKAFGQTPAQYRAGGGGHTPAHPVADATPSPDPRQRH